MDLLIIFTSIAVLTGWAIGMLMRRERAASGVDAEEGQRIEQHAWQRFEERRATGHATAASSCAGRNDFL